MGVHISKIKVDQLRRMCGFWWLKKYREVNRVELGLLIVQNQCQLIGDTLSKSESAFYEKKSLVQASKFHVLHVFFSDDYFDDVIVMNHTKHKDELDEGKAGRSEHLWSSISELYNDSTNGKEFGEFTYIEDEQIAQFASQFSLSKYLKLDWVKASHSWLKTMVKDYHAAMILFTKSGTRSAAFYDYCKNKTATFYYRLYIMSRPDSHK
jgi:hypothetical protein